MLISHFAASRGLIAEITMHSILQYAAKIVNFTMGISIAKKADLLCVRYLKLKEKLLYFFLASL